MNKSFDVFLSHNSKDKPLVRKIAKRLEKYGLTSWLDEKDLRPGLPFQDGLEEAMRTTCAAAVFLGAHGLGSWQRPEVRACLSQMVKRGQPVIPVLLPGAPEKPEIGLLLRENTWVDLRNGMTKEGLDRLVWGITGEKPEPSKPLSSPTSSKEVAVAKEPRSQSGISHISTLDAKSESPRVIFVGKTSVGKTAIVRALGGLDIPRQYKYPAIFSVDWIWIDTLGAIALDGYAIAPEFIESPSLIVLVIDGEPFVSEIDLFKRLCALAPESPRIVFVNKWEEHTLHMPKKAYELVRERVLEKMGEFVSSPEDIVFGSAMRYIKETDSLVFQALPKLTERMRFYLGNP